MKRILESPENFRKLKDQTICKLRLKPRRVRRQGALVFRGFTT